MKINEIIKEEKHYATDLHKKDSVYNPEADKFALQNQQVYKDRINTPVYTKPEPQKYGKFDSHPKKGDITTPGYRALQFVRKRAGLSYDKSVENYHPSFIQSQNSEQFMPAFNRPMI